MQFFTYKNKYLFLVFSFLVFLCSCARMPPTLEKRLEAQGVRIIHVGETIRVVLSSDLLFAPYSANIQTCQYIVLREVAQFLKRYWKVVVIVAAYTTASDDAAYDKALTRQQASNVVTFLWGLGIDARLMEGIGYGSQCPLSMNCSLNRRVEIVFHYIPDYLHEMTYPIDTQSETLP